ncbi:hypothetical protein AOLI_G00156010 [Acnodon oligacanthus]
MAVVKEIVGIILGLIQWILSVVVCILPMWRVIALIAANFVTAQIICEGLWMVCVMQITGQMQCKVYDSMLALPLDLHAARAMSVISIITALLALIIFMVGTTCIKTEVRKANAMLISGVFFIIPGILVLISVSCTTNGIFQDFYNPTLITAQKGELGASLYIGFGAAALLIIAGGSCALSGFQRRRIAVEDGSEGGRAMAVAEHIKSSILLQTS